MSTRRKANLMQLVMYYLVHKYIDIDIHDIDIDNTIVSTA